MCSKWAPRRCRHIWIRRAKFSMTLPHSALGIALIAAVIAAFRSGIVWGLLPYPLSLRYPTDKNLGGSSLVNAATTAGHICGWSVGQGNAAVSIPMIRLRSRGWHNPTGTTGGPWRPLSVDQVLSRTCQAPGHIARCWLSQTARWTKESLTATTLCGVLDDFGRPECDCLLVILRLRLCTVPWVLNLLTHL